MRFTTMTMALFATLTYGTLSPDQYEWVDAEFIAPAFEGGKNVTLYGTVAQIWEQLLEINPAWNASVVGGPPQQQTLEKREHAQEITTDCGGFPIAAIPRVLTLEQQLHNMGNAQVCAPAGPGKCARIACQVAGNSAKVGYCNDNNYPVCAYATNMGDNVDWAKQRCVGNSYNDFGAQQFYVGARNIIVQGVQGSC